MKKIAVYYNATDRKQYGGERRNDVELIALMLKPYMEGFEFIQVDTVLGELPTDISQFHGAILTGSAAMVDDGEPWIEALLEQIRVFDRLKVKTLGICFGHQAIAKALGGEVGARELTLGAPHLEVLSPQKWMHPYMPSLRLFAGNYQQVTKIPDGMKRVAMGNGNPNAILVKDEHIVSLQFHPELTQMYMEGYVDDCYSRHEITAQVHKQAMSEITARTDAGIMAQWLAHFFKS